VVEDEGETEAPDHRASAVPRPAPLEVRIEDHGGAPVIHVRGELDLSTCEQVETALAQAEGANPPTLVLDLSGISFMDSTGVRTLLQADSRARRDGRRLLLIAPPEPAARVLRVTLLDRRFEFIGDLSELA
jgi:anti-sigma B factor antagonist